ncbi:MAG: dihydropteroate synthase [Candidatus Nitrosotenuis sp.]
MGIINASPESFYKESVKTGQKIADTAKNMESEGADFIDVGGMSTAPYLSTVISEKEEQRRVVLAIKKIQDATNLPISVDTCRAQVAMAALEMGVETINDVSGLKYDPQMIHVVAKYAPSLILCAHGKKASGNLLEQTKTFLKQSIALAKSAGINNDKIVIDPAIGFFRKRAQGPFYTKIASDWAKRDLQVLENIPSIKMGYPILISASNKSFIGKIIQSENPQDRIFGSLTAEAISVINGADIIRTHNVAQTRQVMLIAQKAQRFWKNL